MSYHAIVPELQDFALVASGLKVERFFWKKGSVRSGNVG
jgi:hypothetical protein